MKNRILRAVNACIKRYPTLADICGILHTEDGDIIKAGLLELSREGYVALGIGHVSICPKGIHALVDGHLTDKHPLPLQHYYDCQARSDAEREGIERALWLLSCKEV